MLAEHNKIVILYSFFQRVIKILHFVCSFSRFYLYKYIFCNIIENQQMNFMRDKVFTNIAIFAFLQEAVKIRNALQELMSPSRTMVMYTT